MLKLSKKVLAAFILMFFLLGIFIKNTYETKGESIETLQMSFQSDTDALKNLSLNAGYAALMDGTTGRILYGKSENEPVAMASTTKIMTLVIALEYGNLDDVVTVSKYAQTMPDVQLNIAQGEQYLLKDLLYSLMLESHNDTAVAIAEHIGGSVEGFAELMNQKAEALGCVQTNFVTPNGLDASEHYTTAAELALIARYALQNEKFIEITNTKSWSFNEITTGRSFTVNNKNTFLTMMDGAIGVKTGFTNGAGYCFVGAVERNGQQFISVVLACGWPPNKTYKWSDTKLLMDYGLSHFVKKTIVTSDYYFGTINVLDGVKREIPIYYDKELTLLIGEYEEVNVKYTYITSVEAPISYNQTVGYGYVYIGDTIYDVFPIKALEADDKRTFSDSIWRILTEFL